MIDIDHESSNSIKEKHEKQNMQNELNQIDTIIKNFCENIATKLKVSKCNKIIIDNNINNNDERCKHDLFAMLIYCYPQLIISEKYIAKLMKQIKQQTKEKVFVGMAKMNNCNWKTFDQWKRRAIENLNKW